jgi:hypothetical protein
MISTASGFLALDKSSSVTDVRSCVFFARIECRIFMSLFFTVVFEKTRVLYLLSSVRYFRTSCIVDSRLTRFLKT